jgi:hypothetical protein
MGPDPMAALMANCVSEEGFKIYKFLLFLCNTNISYRLKNMLEPDWDKHVINCPDFTKASDNGNQLIRSKLNIGLQTSMMIIQIPRKGMVLGL